MKNLSVVLLFVIACCVAVMTFCTKSDNPPEQNTYYSESEIIVADQKQFELCSKKQITFFPVTDMKSQISWNGTMTQFGNGIPASSNYRAISDTLYLIQEGKNLIQPSLYTTNKAGLTWIVNKDYSVSISGSCNASGAFNIMTRWLNKGIYRLSGTFGCGSVAIEVIDSNDESLGILTSNQHSKLIWIPSDGEYTIRYLHSPNTNNLNAISYPMLTAGVDRYDYVPYESSQIAVSLPDHFGGGTLSSENTVVLTHYKATLTSNTDLQLLSSEDSIGRFLLRDFMSDALKPAINDEVFITCSTLSTSDKEAYSLSISESQELILTLPLSTVEEAKAWLADMEKADQAVELVYALETPMQLSEYKAFEIVLAEGANTISAPFGILCAVGYEDTSYTMLPNKPVMTFVDDDGRSGSLDTLIRISKGASIEVSAALVTKYVNDPSNENYMNWEDIRQLRGLGASFHSHTNNHIQLNTSVLQKSGDYNGQYITEEIIREDLVTSQALLDENNCNIGILVYPHGVLTSETETIVREYFSGGVTITEGINELPITPYRLLRYNLSREQSGNRDKRTLEDWKQIVDYCAASGGWLIWMLHGYSDNFNDQEIEDIISLCLYAESKGVEIMNLEDGFAYMNNRVTVGDINSEDYYIIDRNGTIYTNN